MLVLRALPSGSIERRELEKCYAAALRTVWIVMAALSGVALVACLGVKHFDLDRGLETDHWALRVDPPSNVKAEYSIFDFTVENGRLISQTHSAISPYWKIVNRRVAVGWTIWKDDEIFDQYLEKDDDGSCMRIGL